MIETNTAWRGLVAKVLRFGGRFSPRDQPILELDHETIAIDMNFPVVTARQTNKRFMAAEAEWILRGRDDVDSLTDYNSRMADYSDDGVTLAGAYGPRIMPQLNYVRDRILADPDTRQATVSVWTPRPGPSRDIPCTVALDFKLRSGLLHTHVFMRSSDVWLGLPYDLFTFTMVTCEVICRLRAAGLEEVKPGILYVTAASSHLYRRDEALAREILGPRSFGAVESLPVCYYTDHPADHLEKLKDSRAGSVLRWWET